MESEVFTRKVFFLNAFHVAKLYMLVYIHI